MKTIEELRSALGRLNFLLIDGCIVFPNYLVHDIKKDEDTECHTMEGLLRFGHGRIKRALEAVDSFEIALNTKPPANGEMGGGFNHASGGGGGNSEPNFAARLNTGGRFQTAETVDTRFRELFGGADIEYGATVSEQGFATRLVTGERTSVGIWGGPGEYVLHNHPSGGNFSDSDLLSVAQTPAKGIAAINKTGGYYFTKGKNFNAEAFAKAVPKAQWPARMSYDQGAAWWLRRNAKKYGYTYEERR